MLRRVVHRRVVNMFDAVASGDHAIVLAGLADDVHHSFAGDHALSGERNDKTAVAHWFERLRRLCPEMRFEIHRTLASGPPWDLRVAVEWTAFVQPAAAPAYVNHGAHVIRLVRGRVKELHAYEDSQVVAQACATMLAAGLEEAGAAPIAS